MDHSFHFRYLFTLNSYPLPAMSSIRKLENVANDLRLLYKKLLYYTKFQTIMQIINTKTQNLMRYSYKTSRSRGDYTAYAKSFQQHFVEKDAGAKLGLPYHAGTDFLTPIPEKHNEGLTQSKNGVSVHF